MTIKKKSSSLVAPPTDLQQQFSEIQKMIQVARCKANSAVDKVLIDLYWHIGSYISAKISNAEWGKAIVDKLALFLQQNLQGQKGFSNKNLWRMKQFYEEYQDDRILSPLVRELGWTQNMIILGQSKNKDEREFYLRMATREKWSKRQLERQLKSRLFERVITAKPKLSLTLKTGIPQSEQVFKDSYSLEFLGLSDNHSEKDLQQSIVSHLKDFIIEFGRDFSFVGENFRVQVGNTDFFLDLLFFHRELQCLVAIELKITEFKPEYMGKMNFYLEALDRDVKKSHEKPSVGLLLCKEKDDEVVEYSLSRNLSPLAVADYKTKLPDKKLLQQKLHEFYELGTIGRDVEKVGALIKTHQKQ